MSTVSTWPKEALPVFGQEIVRELFADSVPHEILLQYGQNA